MCPSVRRSRATPLPRTRKATTMPVMSPSEVRAALDKACFAPGIGWDAESLARFFGCSASQIGAIPGVLRQCATLPEEVRQYEFEQPFLSTVQVAKAMGRSRTAVARLTRCGRLNPRRGRNDAALFLVGEVSDLNGWTLPVDGFSASLARRHPSMKSGKQRSQESKNVDVGMTAAALHPTSPPSNTDRLRALLLEDVRLFEKNRRIGHGARSTRPVGPFHCRSVRRKRRRG